MYNIVIVEDDPDDRDAIKSYLDRYGSETGQTFKITEFDNAVKFLTDYNPIYDIVFLDIQMPYMDGMQAAEKLREVDSEVPLVFITNMSDYAVKGYSVDAIDFVMKPVPYPNFYAMMNKVVRIVEKSAEAILLKTPTGKVKLRVDSVSHIEVLDHKTYYHTDSGDHIVWGSLKEQEELLPADRFAKCNNYCIVNLKYVDGIIDGAVLLRGDEVTNIPISRSKKKELTDRLLTYYGRYV